MQLMLIKGKHMIMSGVLSKATAPETETKSILTEKCPFFGRPPPNFNLTDSFLLWPSLKEY